LLAALSNVWIPEGITEASLPGKVTAQALLAKADIFNRVNARREQNKRCYQKRKAKTLTEGQSEKQEQERNQGFQSPSVLNTQRTQSEQEQPPTPAELAAFAESNNDRNATATPQSLQAFLAGRRRFDKILADIASGRANVA
jgi:hypothetical protein